MSSQRAPPLPNTHTHRCTHVFTHSDTMHTQTSLQTHSHTVHTHRCVGTYTYRFVVFPGSHNSHPGCWCGWCHGLSSSGLQGRAMALQHPLPYSGISRKWPVLPRALLSFLRPSAHPLHPWPSPWPSYYLSSSPLLAFTLWSSRGGPQVLGGRSTSQVRVLQSPHSEARRAARWRWERSWSPASGLGSITDLPGDPKASVSRSAKWEPTTFFFLNWSIIDLWY